MKIKYDTQIMKLMYFFESQTGAKLKDCFIDKNNTLTFVVNENIGRAIGRNGESYKKLSAKLKRSIKIFAYSDKIEEFVRNMVLPLRVRSVELREKTVIIKPEPESRGYIIGRGGSNLRIIQNATQRYFDIDEVKVL